MKKPEWQMRGQEPDYRFSLANERTFLAWIRTALALLAAGILLESLAPRLWPTVMSTPIAIALALSAAALAASAYRQWRANEIAMRHSAPLPGNLALTFLSGVVLAVAVLGVLVFARP